MSNTTKKYFQITFKYSEEIFCTNIAHASTINEINAKYSDYEIISCRECESYEVESAKRRHMPIVEI